MRLPSLCVFATLTTLVWSLSSLAQGEPKDLIIGKWEAEQKAGAGILKINLEFTKDTIKVSFDTFKVEGKYKWADKDTLEVTGMDNKEMTEKTKVVVTKDTLSLTGKDGKETKFTRVKEATK